LMCIFFFCFTCYGHHRHLHSFPTRRSSDLLFNAFIETLQMVLGKPVVAFTAMKREGGLGEPLLYAVIGGTFGGVFAVTYNFALRDRKSTRLNSSHDQISYAVFCLKKKKK